MISCVSRFNVYHIFSMLVPLFLLCSCSNKVQKSPVVADGAKLVMISDQFSFTEGPAADKAGNVFFTDQPNNSIWKYSTNGKLSLFMHSAGRSNGMYFDQQGNLITCADKKDQLWSINPQKKVTVLVKDFHGHRLNGPNDVWIDPKGGIYFTDPYYQRSYWSRTKPDIKEQRVYYLTPERQKVIIIADNLVKPNGIIGTADGKHLYISDIAAQKIYSYSVSADGHLSHKSVFAEKRSDGMTLDNKGNVYLATPHGVIVFNRESEQIDQITVPQQPSNLTFGGKNNHTLFITARTAVYKLKMKVSGAN